MLQFGALKDAGSSWVGVSILISVARAREAIARVLDLGIIFDSPTTTQLLSLVCQFWT